MRPPNQLALWPDVSIPFRFVYYHLDCKDCPCLYFLHYTCDLCVSLTCTPCICLIVQSLLSKYQKHIYILISQDVAGTISLLIFLLYFPIFLTR